MDYIRQSMLNSFEKCLYKGFKEYGAYGSPCPERPDDGNKYSLTGIIFHEVMEIWGNNKMNDIDLPIESLHNLLETKFRELDIELFDGSEDIEKFNISLHNQLDWVYENCKLSEICPKGVEVSFELEGILDDVIVSGIIDRIDGSIDSKEIILGDYKTGKTYTKKELSNNMQATLYCLAMYKMTGIMPSQFVFYFSKHKKIKTIYITPEFIKQGMARIQAIYQKIKLGEYSPTCDNKYFCKHFCEYIKECPKYTKKLGWDNV